MITIIGAGSVGLALGKAFIAKGEQVCFGVTDVRKYVPVIKPMPGARLSDSSDSGAPPCGWPSSPFWYCRRCWPPPC